MKRRTLILWLLLFTTVCTFAYDFKSGDLYYNIKDDGTAEVTYQKFRSSDNYSKLTSVIIPESVTYQDTTYSVTSIGGYAFSDCTSLTSITIGNSVTAIEDGAFSRCSGLTSVIWNAKYCSDFSSRSTPFYYIGSISPFDLRSQITSFTFGDSVRYIPAYICNGMNRLTAVTIPNSVDSIGGYAFLGCIGLTSVTIPNSVTVIKGGAFSRCSGLTSVIWNAKKCSDFSSRSTPFYYIGSINPFDLRSQITSFTFGDSVRYIPAYICDGMSNLTSITIPNSVDSIGGYTFSDCTGLTSVTIGNGVTSIGEYAFSGCSGLTSVIWNAKYCSDFSSRSTPFYYIGSISPFDLRSQITSFTFGDSVRYIPAYICDGMSNLTSITIPNSVDSIGGYAFSDCTGLTSVTIGNSVITIGWSAFSDCTGLTSVTCYAIEPPTAGDYTFNGVNENSIPLYTPEESVEKYKVAEGWMYFREILPISAALADVDEPMVDPIATTVTITWPAMDNAATYTIEISKDGTLVCTLTFDANGVLKNMRFAAPSRYAAQNTTQAEATGSGFRFVVEGLDYATTYTYRITAKDADDNVVESYNGTFTTTDPYAGTEDVRSVQSQPATRKVFRNGQMYIIRGENTYTTTGSQL